MKVLLIFISLSLTSVISAAQGEEVPQDKRVSSRLQPRESFRRSYIQIRNEIFRSESESKSNVVLVKSLKEAYAKYKSTSQFVSDLSATEMAPSWADEEFTFQGESVRIHDVWGKFKNWIARKSRPRSEDLAFNFVETSDNQAEILAGNESFWPRLIEDITNAKSSINIQMFGITADAFVVNFAKLLAQKAAQGVKVRILADQLGAGMCPFIKKGPLMKVMGVLLKDGPERPIPSKDLFDFLRNHNIETVLIPPRLNGPNFQLDHRKLYVIDGKIGYNTGYTLQKEMREIKFDEGVRFSGSLVHQFQLSFFSSWIFNGGKISTEDLDSFDFKYFPNIESPNGTSGTALTMKVNVPGVRAEVTESYLDLIDRAEKYIYVVTPYFASGAFFKALEKAAQRGVEVRVVVPKVPVGRSYAFVDNQIFREFSKYGIKSYSYLGPKNYGLIHAKGMLVDGKFVSIGSCNMDPFSLLFNNEINILSSDPAFVQSVQREMFNYIFQYSEPYKPFLINNFDEKVEVGASEFVVGAARSLIEYFGFEW